MRISDWSSDVCFPIFPDPVLTGFTAGIAVIIFTSQLKDLFGLAPAELPAEFLPKLGALWAARDSFDAATFGIAAAALAVILALRRHFPRMPAFLVAIDRKSTRLNSSH